MKQIFTFLAVVLLTVSVAAQSPEKMSYQAVIRNNSDALVTNTQIGMQISILQGSIYGAAVYVETQTLTTNANGLVSIEIGVGTVLNGDFATIDWANGSYFIKTETDLAGGTSYSITGISQLLSVPYALHAKMAESISGSAMATHYVGELYGGGVVFWVDHTGEHGLIVSMIDLEDGTGGILHQWSNLTSTEIGPTAQSDWDGNTNTLAIIGQSGHTSSAAQLCADYTNADYGTGIYSDWYLPSKGELNDLGNNFKAVQKALDSDGNVSTIAIIRYSSDHYYSSTEYFGNSAMSFRFHYCSWSTSPKNLTCRVRAVRAF